MFAPVKGKDQPESWKPLIYPFFKSYTLRFKTRMPGSTGVEEISHVFSFFNCTLHFKGPQHPESTGIIILSHTIVLLSIQAHAP